MSAPVKIPPLVDVRWNKVRNALARYAQLKDGWDGPDSIAPLPRHVTLFQRMVAEGERLGVREPQVFAASCGELNASWYGDSQHNKRRALSWSLFAETDEGDPESLALLMELGPSMLLPDPEADGFRTLLIAARAMTGTARIDACPNCIYSRTDDFSVPADSAEGTAVRVGT